MKHVVLLVLDFDGVLTDNRVQVHQSGEESVWCHRGDGWGIARLKDAGFDIVVLSTETNPVVTARCRKLNIEALQGCDDKAAALRQLAHDRKLSPQQIAYVGNDLNDLSCMQWVGWPIAVADAVPEIRALAKWVTHLPGGRGAVREVTDRLLHDACEKDTSLERARKSIWRSIELNQAMAGSSELLTHLLTAAQTIATVLQGGGRVFVFGDAPSAVAARHLAAVIGRLADDPHAMPPAVLTVDRHPESRTPNHDVDDLALVVQLGAQARAGDMAVGITVPGDSSGVLRAMDWARLTGLHTLALTGASGGQMQAVSDICLCAPSQEPRTIQDAHLLVCRVLADCTERILRDDSPDDL